MKIHIESQQVFASDVLAYRHYRQATQRAIPIELLDWAAEGYADFTETSYGPATHKQDGVENVGGWRRKIVARTAEELAAEKQANIDSIFRAAEEYCDSKGGQNKGRISKYSLGRIERKSASGGKQKCADLTAWVDTVFGLAYQREGAVLQGAPMTPAMLDFSAGGQMPGTIAEALQE